MTSQPTSKQIALAKKLFARNAELSKKYGLPLEPGSSFESEMICMEWNPQDRRDVSAYIALYLNARAEAAKTLRRY